MPAVMNSMSQPSMSSTMRSRSSIAACRPISGSAPAPRPLVILAPICSEVLIFDALSACESVLMQMKSTPSIPLVTMCETALPPPPPTPITLITALWLYASMSSNMSVSSLRSVKSEIAFEPALHAPECAGDIAGQRRRARSRRRVFAGVEQQPHAGGINRIAHHVGQAAHVARKSQPHRYVEYFLSQLNRPFHARTAAGQDDAGGDHFFEAAAPQLLADQIEQFFVARLDHFGQRLARQPARRPIADARHFDALIRIGELRERAGVANLDVLGILRVRTHRH